MVMVLNVNDRHFERKLGADQPLKMAGTAGLWHTYRNVSIHSTSTATQKQTNTHLFSVVFAKKETSMPTPEAECSLKRNFELNSLQAFSFI